MGAEVRTRVRRRLRRKTPSRRDIWHLDEVMITISGKKHWLWRAVDQGGYVLDEILQHRRATEAAKRLLERLLRKQGGPPRRIIIDKLGSYAVPDTRLYQKLNTARTRGSTIARKFASAVPSTRAGEAELSIA